MREKRLTTRPAPSHSATPTPAAVDAAALTRVPAWAGRLAGAALLQAKLTVNQPGDAYEQEADRVAEQVLRRPTAQLPQPRRLDQFEQPSAAPLAPPDVQRVLQAPGRPLDAGTRAFMEPRFGADFSQVRVHTDPQASASARAINALAYTVGRDVVFGTGQYAPGTPSGRALIAHELTHTLQQRAAPAAGQVQRYTEEQRREMAEGRVTARQSDIDLANQRRFQPGDIVFRMGSTALGFLTGEPVTHGGIYIGNGLIHDVVGFGNRHVRVGDFFDPALGEAADRNVYRTVRFRGPLRDLIVGRLLSNIQRRDFDMPTDPVPFNLFSSADDYRTATCLEYAHAQFLHAIRRLAADPSVSEADRAQLRSTYFDPGAAAPRALIRPQEQRLIGNTPTMSGASGGGGTFGSGPSSSPPRTPSALIQEAALVAAASALATDVDPSRFRNRAETTYTQHWPGGSGIGGTILNFLMGPTYDEVVLRTFTYRSFVDSRQFFEDVTGH